VPEELTTISADEFLGDLQSISLLGATLPGTSGPLALEGARITRADLSGSRLVRPSLVDVLLTGCNLANARWGGGALTRVTFQECQMTGFDVNSAALIDVQFLACKLSLSSFRFLSKAKVRFADCEMDGTDFQGVDLRGCRFERCILTGSLFHEAKAQGLDLRGSSITGLQGLGGLGGAVIDHLQLLDIADTLASHAGLTVSERS
jgi:uncharacterized protein YjbI with pentapeptide repeats